MQMPSGEVFFKVPFGSNEIDVNFAMLASMGVGNRGLERKLSDPSEEQR